MIYENEKDDLEIKENDHLIFDIRKDFINLEKIEKEELLRKNYHTPIINENNELEYQEMNLIFGISEKLVYSVCSKNCGYRETIIKCGGEYLKRKKENMFHKQDCKRKKLSNIKLSQPQKDLILKISKGRSSDFKMNQQ